MFSIQAEDFDWPQCSVVDCQGAQLNGGRCVRHLDGDEARGDVLADIDRTGDIDVRGVRLDADLVQELIKRCPVVDGRVRVRNLRCDLARFEGEAEFADMTLENASFYAARFEAEPSFEDLVFEKSVSFDNATFVDGVMFLDSQFKNGASFGGARFDSLASFYDLRFAGVAGFWAAQFKHGAHFERVTFADFDFSSAQVDGDVQFLNTRFTGTVGDEWVVILGKLDLSSSTFEQDMSMQFAADAVVARRTRFLGRSVIEARWAEIALTDADFFRPSVITAARQPIEPEDFVGLREPDGGWDVRFRERCEASRRRTERPRILSIEGASVEQLLLVDVDLRPCRFRGAHNLDRLRFEGAWLPRSPTRRVGVSRRTLAEEHSWRMSRSVRQMRRWSDPAVALPEWWTRFEDSEVTRPLRATEVAALYRQLRKGREDSKDEPGAADFYYGEMEMRRLGERTERSFGEKIVLSSYWLTSGYGLRAGRAIGALATAVAVLAGLLYLVGLHSRDWSAAMLQALNAALFRAPDATLLTEAGQYLVIPIRILGPVLVALTFLAMRARVKR